MASSKTQAIDIVKLNGKARKGKILSFLSKSWEDIVEMHLDVGAKKPNVIKLVVDKKDLRSIVRSV